jgi:hypothetical protein
MNKKELLTDNGFMPWRFGHETKLEGYIDQKLCKKLIGVEQKCYTAILLEENEVRLITSSNFDKKVSGHEDQINIEKIIFGEDKNKLYKGDRLVLLEDIIPLDDLIEELNK